VNGVIKYIPLNMKQKEILDHYYGEKSKIGVSEILKRNRIKRPGRHSKKHKGKKKSERGQGHP
jgi:hypothetical protein